MLYIKAPFESHARAGGQGTITPLSALSFDLSPSMAALNGSVHDSDLVASNAASVWHYHCVSDHCHCGTMPV